jgi:single-strand DNA-binding protein
VRNKAAEMCEYLSKGIYRRGRIRSRQWQTEDGTVKYTSEIQVTEFTFCQPKGGENKQTLNRPKTLTLTHKIMACQSMIC